jgi:hypothetical protein
MRAAGHLSVKFGRVIGALASDINGLRGSVLCDGSLPFLASGEKPRLKAKTGASSPAHWREMIRDLWFGNPLIAGLTNDDDSLHAVVVTAVTYRRGWDGAPAYESAVIRDPWLVGLGLLAFAVCAFVRRANEAALDEDVSAFLDGVENSVGQTRAKYRDAMPLDFRDPFIFCVFPGALRGDGQDGKFRTVVPRLTLLRVCADEADDRY